MVNYRSIGQSWQFAFTGLKANESPISLETLELCICFMECGQSTLAETEQSSGVFTFGHGMKVRLETYFLLFLVESTGLGTVTSSVVLLLSFLMLDLGWPAGEISAS